MTYLCKKNMNPSDREVFKINYSNNNKKETQRTYELHSELGPFVKYFYKSLIIMSTKNTYRNKNELIVNTS